MRSAIPRILALSFSILFSLGANSPISHLDKDQRIQLISKSLQIRIGSTVDSVLSLLGKPSGDTTVISKGSGRRTRLLTYYIYEQSPPLPNSDLDQFVSLAIVENKVKSITIKASIE